MVLVDYPFVTIVGAYVGCWAIREFRRGRAHRERERIEAETRLARWRIQALTHTAVQELLDAARRAR